MSTVTEFQAQENVLAAVLAPRAGQDITWRCVCSGKRVLRAKIPAAMQIENHGRDIKMAKSQACNEASLNKA